MASTYDLNITQGSSFNIRLTAKDSNSNYINLSGYSVSGQIRNRFSDSSALMNMKPVIVSGQSVPTVPANLSNDAIFSGLVDVSLAAFNTSALPITQAIYDIEVYKSINISASDFANDASMHPDPPAGEALIYGHFLPNGVITIGNAYSAGPSLEFEPDTPDDRPHYIRLNHVFEEGLQYNVQTQIYIPAPSTNNTVGKVYVNAHVDPTTAGGLAVGAPGTKQYNLQTIEEYDTWVDVNATFFAGPNTEIGKDPQHLHIYAGGPSPDYAYKFAGSAISNFYMHDVEITQVPGTVIKLLNGKANVHPEATY